ncbi:DNA-binding transcriptional regulator, LysR family [Tardiphaga sp. OK246]|uniref:LysR family transcriptional regulator n=1 Tax=Tardiphaga sp. OK246 TaxID=1855307 RepID=UPI000B759880|nr:LysR family transcriptional regulator [Tardiphaga sp. OK246]SNT31935.1 DNA-binding transcriptional regulator, LysR family [Tardiphaga sp. OK246]
MATELEIFVLVAESGGFASTARVLRLTPSAISRRIAILEDRVGVQLLSRTTRKVELTTAGEVYFQKIKPLLAAISAATRNLEQFSPVPSGQLRIGAPAALLERRLVALVSRYLDDYPQIRVEMLPTEIGINGEEFDFVIQSLPSSDKGKVSIKLAENPWIICAAPSYLEENGIPEHPLDLQNHRCLAITTHQHWQFLVDGHELALVPPARFLSFGGAVYKAAIDGLGIAQLAAFLVNEDLRTGKLIRVLEQFKNSSERYLYLIADKEKLDLVKHSSFADFLQQSFEAGF